MWIEIFKSGKHKDSSGHEEMFTDEKLDKIAGIYNSKIAETPSLEAPLVKGHPKTDAPAFGWIEKLKRNGSVLLAKLKDVSPDLIKEVKKGMYKKVSVALYPNLMLRHVGMLGAVAPAVKGLKMVSFNDEDSFKEYDVLNHYSELDLVKAENIQLKRKFNLISKETRLKEFREFANSLIENVDGAIITPAHVNELIDLLESAYISDTELKEFADDVSNVEKLKSFIGGLQPAFSFGEFATKPFAESSMNEDDLAFKNASPVRLELHRRAKELQTVIPGLSYEEAVCRSQVASGK